MTSRRTLVALTLVASIGLAACGEGTGGLGLSRKDIVAKANAICRKSQRASAKIPMPTNALIEYKPTLKYFAKLAPTVQRKVREFAALEPDSETAADWNAFLGKSKTTVAWLQKVRKKVGDQDPSLLEESKMIDPMLTAPTVAAKRLGLTGCG